MTYVEIRIAGGEGMPVTGMNHVVVLTCACACADTNEGVAEDIEPGPLVIANQTSNNTEDEGPMSCTVQVNSADAVDPELDNDQQNSVSEE